MVTQVLLAAFCCGAVVQDIATGKIKNAYNVIAAVIAFGCVLVTKDLGVRDSLFGLGFSVLLGSVMWRVGAIRAGDAKCMWTLGILKGWKGFGISMIYAILAGGVMAFCIVLVKKDFKKRILRLWLYFKSVILLHCVERYEADGRDVFPFSVPLAIGCLLEAAIHLPLS